MKAISTAYMNEVLEECKAAIPLSQTMPNPDLIERYPTRYPFRMERATVRALAAKARRFTRSQAEAIEWAFDALLARTGYLRNSEVYAESQPKYMSGLASLALYGVAPSAAEMADFYIALCIERA